MPDDSVIDIKSRMPGDHKPSILAIADQLIATEDIREILQVLGDISNEGWSPQLLPNIPNTPEIQQRIHDIIYEAVTELYRLEDSLKTRN